MKNSEILQQNVFLVFAKYVSLNVLSMIGFSFYILADTFFVANGVGEPGLVALNLCLPAYGLLSGIGLMLGIGGGTLFSIAMGSGMERSCHRIFTQCAVSGLAVGVLLTGLGVFFSKEIVIFLGADETYLPLASNYIRTVFSFSIAFILNHILVCFVRNDANPNLSMTAMLTGSFTNIILDYIFIIPLDMGMFGAALATGLAPVISLCVLSLHFIKKKNHFSIKPCKFRLKDWRQMVTIGIPSFITEVSTGAIIFVFNIVIIGIIGDVGVAAYGIVANIALVSASVFNGIGQGIQPIISLHYGAGNRKQIKKVVVCSCTLAVILGTLFYMLGMLFPEAIAGIFNRDQNAVLTQLTVYAIHRYFIAFLFMGLNYVFISFFASITKTKQSLLLSCLRGFMLVIPAILILPALFGIDGVWMAVPLSELLTLLIGIVLVVKTSQMSKKDKM